MSDVILKIVTYFGWCKTFSVCMSCSTHNNHAINISTLRVRCINYDQLSNLSSYIHL